MSNRLNHDREPRVHTGHRVQAVKDACNYLRSILDETVLGLLNGVERLSKPKFLAWFNKMAPSLGLNRDARLHVLAIVR